MKATPTSKSHHIIVPPNRLLLCIARFNHDVQRNKETGESVFISKKRHNEVDLKSNVTVLGLQYELCGVLYHRGNSPKAGHYWTDAERNNHWYQFNDSKVTKIEDIKKQLALIE